MTKKNLIKLFNTPIDICCGLEKPEWTTCYDKDSSYYTADTIQLYRDKYHYLTVHCCFDFQWSFNKRKSFTISKTIVCQEPPITIVSLNDCDLKIKFKQANDKLILLIYKDGNLVDMFILLSLESIEMKNEKPGYRLTMIRRKI